jgi:glycosyltransferase involved in cell wall biosynthesis
MVFAKRNVAAITALGIPGQTFYLRSRTSPVMLAAEARRLRREIRAFRPNIVHAHFGTVTAMFTILVSPCPVVITYRGSDLIPSRGDSWLRRTTALLLSQLAALFARRLICSSREMKERLWWHRDQCAVYPTGVDTGLFFPRSRVECRTALGWDQDARIVLFNAGTDPVRKRLDLARSAVHEARRLIGPIEFVVLQGKTDPDRIPLFMGGADCLLVTSDSEGSPTVVQEALASNLPVISVDVADVAERLAGVTPSAIVARDPVALGCAVADVLRTRVRSNGQDALREVSTEAVGRGAVAVYHDVLAHPR